MRYGALGLMFLSALAAGAAAQTPSTQPTAPAPSAMPPAATPPVASRPPAATSPTAAAPRADAPATAVVDARLLEAGANSFTEGQAKARFEEAGFTAIQGLVRDDAGFWRARGMRNGAAIDLAMDFRGRIAAGPGVATLPRQASAAGARGVTAVPPASTPATPR